MHIELENLTAQTVIGVRETVKMTDLTDFMGRALTASAAELLRQKLVPTGPPLSIYHGDVGATCDITAGFPVTRPGTAKSGTVIEPLTHHRAVTTVFTGPYDALTGAYEQVMAWISAHGVVPASVVWEEYLVGPDNEPDPKKWQTRIVIPVVEGVEAGGSA